MTNLGTYQQLGWQKPSTVLYPAIARMNRQETSNDCHGKLNEAAFEGSDIHAPERTSG